MTIRVDIDHHRSFQFGDFYSQRVLATSPDNLIAYWRLNETSGSVIQDSTRNGHDGTYTGVTLDAVDAPEGEGHRAPSLDGINDYGNVHSSELASAFNGDEITVSLWAKLDSSAWTDGSWHIFCSFRVGSYIIYIGKTPTNNTLRFIHFTSASKYIDYVFSTDTFFKVDLTVSLESDEMKAYINGAQVGSTLSGMGSFGTLTNAEIGAATNLGRYFFGNIAHVALWDTVLSASQISDLYDTTNYDDVTNYIIPEKPLKFNVGLRPYSTMGDENECTFYVSNTSQMFSPENTSSPLYGLLKRNRMVQVKFDSTIMWAGMIDKVEADPFLFGGRMAKITCRGNMIKLKKLEIYPNLLKSVTTDQIIESIVGQVVSVPASQGYWSLGVTEFSELDESTYLGSVDQLFTGDTGKMTFEYTGDNLKVDELGMVSAYDVIRQACMAEQGRFFFAREGKAVFWNRHHLFENNTVAALTFDNTATELRYTTPDKFYANEIRVRYYPRDLAESESTLWSLKRTLVLGVDEERIIYADFVTSSGKIIGADDVNAPSVSAGTLTISSGSVDVFMDVAGQQATLRMVAGASGATITQMDITGKELKSYNSVQYVAADGERISEDGLQSKSYNLKMLSDHNDAKDIANYILHYLPQSTGQFMSLTMRRAANGTRNADQVIDQTGKMFSIIDDQLSHTRNYYIVGEEHSFVDGGFMHETTWFLEPATDGLWLLGFENSSELGESTRLGF